MECSHIINICPVLLYFCGFHIYDLLYYTLSFSKNVLIFSVNYNFCKMSLTCFEPFFHENNGIETVFGTTSTTILELPPNKIKKLSFILVKTEQAKGLTLERKMIVKSMCPMNGRALTVFHTELEGHVKEFHGQHHGNIHTICIC
jgi:hypothetical protein